VTDPAHKQPFWRTKTLAEMSPGEWESLCDGCAKCCLEKLEDEETGEVSYTEIGCTLLDGEACRCKDYDNRANFVPDCVRLSAGNLADLKWLPSTCAYLLISKGEDLPDWHPLVTGNAESVHRAGQSVRGRVIDEKDADDFEDHIVTWPE